MSIRPCTICKKNFDSFKRRPDEIFCDDCYEQGCANLKGKKDDKSAGEREVLAQKNALEDAINKVKLSTTPEYPNLKIDNVMGVITSECVFGMNLFRDMFAAVRDAVGGRSSASQKVLRDAKTTCLYELKREAHELGADGVIGIDLDYSEISGGGKSMLFLVASGTAVKFKKESAQDRYETITFTYCTYLNAYLC